MTHFPFNLNNKGFGLTETIMAMGIASVMLLGTSEMIGSAFKNQKKIASANEISNFVQRVQLTLNYPESCKAPDGGTNQVYDGKTNLDTFTLYNPSGARTALPNISNPSIGGGLKLTQFSLAPSTANPVGTQFSYLTQLVITATDNSSPPKTYNKNIPITINTDKNNNIISCNSSLGNPTATPSTKPTETCDSNNKCISNRELYCSINFFTDPSCYCTQYVQTSNSIYKYSARLSYCNAPYFLIRLRSSYVNLPSAVTSFDFDIFLSEGFPNEIFSATNIGAKTTDCFGYTNAMPADCTVRLDQLTNNQNVKVSIKLKPSASSKDFTFDTEFFVKRLPGSAPPFIPDMKYFSL